MPSVAERSDAASPADGSGAAGIGAAVERGLAHLARDGFVAYPTETVWGLGAPADRDPAVERLVEWKGRSERSPLAVLVPDLAAAEGLGCAPGADARRLAAACWPGPLMLVVPCRRRWAPGVARDDGALGLRCSPHPLASALAAALLAAGQGPLTSTSLNRSGEPPAADAEAARALCGRGDPAEGEEGAPLDAPFLLDVDGLDAGGAAPSTVVDCTGPEPEILRVGAIDRSRVLAILAGDRA